MQQELSVEHGGARYQVEARPTEAVNELSAQAPDAWHVVRDGVVITTFPVEPGDTPASVREKVVSWVDAKPTAS